jgi:hypothetical protein
VCVFRCSLRMHAVARLMQALAVPPRFSLLPDFEWVCGGCGVVDDGKRVGGRREEGEGKCKTV